MGSSRSSSTRSGIDLILDDQAHLYASPFFRSILGDDADVPMHTRIVAEGQFDGQLLDAVRGRGQPVLELPTSKVGAFRGWGGGITIDPVTGRRLGAASRHSGGLAIPVATE